ncbi:hypothetical protein NECAME_05575 [Necator americanus]|uniref:Uncharacterized protein n=1 Tax=Necator americanus TaxID=51031 RepID=W2SIA8_NECAM|nr:hypothetical protein NECAME_05575 [Necator americanus]ETN68492.1 hypothetical protein NECAME_05575 [Necator americanus]
MSDTADVDAAPYRVAIFLTVVGRDPRTLSMGLPYALNLSGVTCSFVEIRLRLLCREPDPHLAQADQCFK